MEKIYKYVIITPARNEEYFIEQTIQSVVSQTVRPLRWVIVNDGSTDRTKEIVERNLPKYNFISLINIIRSGDRNFGKKAIAFHRGMNEIGDHDYEFIGNLDADISLEPDYFRKILDEFYLDSTLGIGGGIVYSKIGEKFSTSDRTSDSVGGAVQLFRRTCFEDIGGYKPLEWGGIDAAAEINAKMLGWKVRKFNNLKVCEHRRTGTAQARPLLARVNEGRRFYSLGYGLPLYFVRCVFRAKDPPLIIGSIAAFWGFVESVIKRRPILLSPEMVAHWRNEHYRRLKNITFRILKLNN